jgi:hypothetical protein
MGKQTIGYYSPPAKPRYTAFNYVTATISGIVAFTVGWFITSLIFSIAHGHQPTVGVLRNCLENLGLFGLPVGLAIIQFRSELRILDKKKQKRARLEEASNAHSPSHQMLP